MTEESTPREPAPDWAFDLDVDGLNVLTPEENDALIDRLARTAVGLSGEEFLRRWAAGEFQPVPDTEESRPLQRLAMMLSTYSSDAR